MDRPRRLAKIAVWVLLALTLGAVTTFVVSAALGAWLPHRGLWEVTGFADVAPRAGAPRDLMGVCTTKFGRAGMERRDWFPMIPGLDIMGTRLSREWSMGPNAVTRTLPTQYEADESAQWGALGEVSRGERDAELPVADDARGWPLLAFWCEINESQTSRATFTVKGGIQLPTRSTSVGSVRCVPYRPIWSGLALDTLMYAAAWALTLLCLPATRRRYRRSRGRCPRCGYDLRHEFATGCPECGWNRLPKLPA